MPKVSWLDSVRMPARIHVADINANKTLCGYGFQMCFDDGTWIPYRNGKKRGICPTCINLAKAKNIDYKTWDARIPERNIDELPISSQIKQRISRKD